MWLLQHPMMTTLVWTFVQPAYIDVNTLQAGSVPKDISQEPGRTVSESVNVLCMIIEQNTHIEHYKIVNTPLDVLEALAHSVLRSASQCLTTITLATHPLPIRHLLQQCTNNRVNGATSHTQAPILRLRGDEMQVCCL